MDFGQKSELDQLYREYAKPLYYFSLKMSGSSYLAEDLTQETFVRATVSLSFYDQGDVRGWLFKVARNAYLDEWRRQQRRKRIPFVASLFRAEEMISPYGLPEEELINAEENQVKVTLHRARKRLAQLANNKGWVK